MVIIIIIIIQFLSCDLKLCHVRGHQSRFPWRPGLLESLLWDGQRSEHFHCRDHLGPSWAVCWMLLEGGEEGRGLVARGAGGRGQPLLVTNPKEAGFN